MITLMDKSSQKSDLYDVTRIYKYHYGLHHHYISERLYLDDYIYNTKYEKGYYYVDMSTVTADKPNLYYADAENNNYKYHFGLQYNSKSSETLCERSCEYGDGKRINKERNHRLPAWTYR